NGLGAVAPGGVLLLLDPLPQLVPARRQVPAGVQEALEGRPGSGVAEVVLCQLDPLLLQGVVLEQRAGDPPGLLGLGLREAGGPRPAAPWRRPAPAGRPSG